MSLPMGRNGLRTTLSVSLLVFLCTGCGGVGDVSGKISYKGAALKGGYVTFTPKDGGPTFSSGIQQDGSYSIAKIPSGTYKISVDTEFLKGSSASSGTSPSGQRSGGGPKAAPPPTGAMSPEKEKAYKPPPAGANPEQMGGPGGPMAAMKKANLEKYVQIPSQYAKAETTTLEYTVSGGSQTHPIDMN